MEYFYQYDGSMTAPPCTEGVSWNVYSKVLKTRKKYIVALKKLFSENQKFAFGLRGNNRRTQEMGERQLYFNSAAGGSFSGATAAYASIAMVSVAASALAF